MEQASWLKNVKKRGKKLFGINKDGKELMDPKPVAIPAAFTRPPSLHEQIARVVRSEQWKAKMEELHQETWEEADDFEVGDDYEPVSPHELGPDQEQASFDSFIEEMPVETKPEAPTEEVTQEVKKDPAQPEKE